MTAAHDHEGDLATLVREHVTRDEPPFLMSADTAMAVGRRALVRRRARRGLAGVLVAAAAVAAVPLMPWHGATGGGADKTGIDPATAAALESYDAQKMPALIDEHARAVLSRSVDDLGPMTFTAGDGQSQPLPAKYYDKASSMEVSYGGTSDHRFRVYLAHSGSEAEGSAERYCAEGLEWGEYFSCTVSTDAAGDTAVTTVSAERPYQDSWALLTREELSSGTVAPTDPAKRPIVADDVYFVRSVKVVHSETFVTSAAEVVKAFSEDAANALWKVPPADLEEIATDPTLVIPKPPLDEGNCPWTLGSGITCSTTND